MGLRDSEAGGALERSLRREFIVLERVRDELGARSVLVFFARDGEAVQIVYRSPETEQTEHSLLLLKSEWGKDVDGSPRSAADGSFLLFRWGVRMVNAVVAFGFADRNGSRMSLRAETTDTVHRIAMATWCVYEIRRLRTELATVSERLGRRKLIERAKAFLQAKHGLTEQQAYEQLRMLSRQRRMPMGDVAESMLQSWS